MKILITGCAGFIGINYLNYLFKRHPDDQIIGIDKLTYAANTEELSKLLFKQNLRFYKEDVCKSDAINAIFEKELPDTVINFAAESHVDNSIKNPELFLKTNVLGTQVLLDASLKFGVKRFHQVSTDEVYGDMPTNSDLTFDENSPLNPSSPYSASKASADLLTLAYRKTHGLSVSISRSSNNYGMYQHKEKFIPKSINSAVYNKPIEIYGDGSNVRNWLWVEDNCRAIDLIARSGKDGEIYNIGSNTYVDNLTLAKYILNVLGKSTDNIRFIADRKGHDKKYSIDSSKIRRELSWTDEMPFNKGLSETINFFRNKT